MLYRLQVVLKHWSGFARDNVVNTFHVDGANDGALAADELAQAVRDFYVVDPVAGGMVALSSKLGTQIAETGHEVRVYAINKATGASVDGEGAPPRHIEGFDLLGRDAVTDSMPSEVAVCLSMKNTTQLNAPIRRRRGRVFIGPLESALVKVTGADGVPRVAPDFQAALVASGLKLRADIAAVGGDLVIYSRPFEGRGVIERPGHSRGDLPAIAARPGETYLVDQFWVDNTFDTQRRRGERATFRTTG